MSVPNLKIEEIQGVISKHTGYFEKKTLVSEERVL